MVHFSKRYWTVVGLMAVTFAANVWIRAPKAASGPEVNLQRFPRQIGDWHAEESAIDEATKRALHIDQALLRNYVNGNGDRIELFIGYYEDQKFGAQIHSPQHCLPGSGWTIIGQDRVRIPNQATGFVNRLQISKNTENQILFYWFFSRGEVVQNEFSLKRQLLYNALQRKATSVSFYRICTPFKSRYGQANSTVMNFFSQASAYFHSPH